jgi:hypothetical protein
MWERIFPKLEIRPAPITHDCLGRPIVGPCLIWTGTPKSKYPKIWDPDFGKNGDNAAVHRVMYEMFVGPIQDDLDHLCRVKKCASPAHVEDVTARENLRRHMLTRGYVEPLPDDPDTCLRGHPLTPENTTYERANGQGQRRCLTCIRERAWRSRHTEDPPAYRGRNGVKTECPKGHPYSEANTYINPGTGGRVCRKCALLATKRWKERKAAKLAA